MTESTRQPREVDPPPLMYTTTDGTREIPIPTSTTDGTRALELPSPQAAREMYRPLPDPPRQQISD